MQKKHLLGGIAILLLVAAHGESQAKTVCYEGAGTIRLNLEKQGRFTVRNKDSAVSQTTYAVHGTTLGDLANSLATSGTITVGQPDAGAVMGLTVHAARDPQDPEVLFLDCSAREPSATPDTWTCAGLAITDAGPTGPDPFTLTRVSPQDQPECAVFEAEIPPGDAPPPTADNLETWQFEGQCEVGCTDKATATLRLNGAYIPGLQIKNKYFLDFTFVSSEIDLKVPADAQFQGLGPTNLSVEFKNVPSVLPRRSSSHVDFALFAGDLLPNGAPTFVFVTQKRATLDQYTWRFNAFPTQQLAGKEFTWTRVSLPPE